jgi:hypothetical protein
MIPKALHILGGLAVPVILRCIFYCFSWEWMTQAIGVPFVVYALAILLWSPPSDPVPFSHAAAERTRLTVIGVYG